MNSRRLFASVSLCVLLVLAAALVGCSGGSSGGASSGAGSSAPPAADGGASSGGTAQTGHALVVISDFKFTPAAVTVKAGTPVVWENKGQVAHTVTLDDGSVSSPQIAPGATVTHIFKTPGTFGYHCSIHRQMKGTIVVQ